MRVFDSFWFIWILTGVTIEINRFLVADYSHTLTGFMRRTILSHPAGSAVIAAFLVWLLWHWPYDTNHPSWEDMVALASGLLIGFYGWLYRKRKQ